MEQNLNMKAMHIVQAIHHFLDANRAYTSIVDQFIYVIYVLYGIHKKYKVTFDDKTINFDVDNDSLISDIQSYLNALNIRFRHYEELYGAISNVSYDEHENMYVVIIRDYIGYLSYDSPQMKEFFTPKEITSLIAYFININHCRSVFDPFCGSALIVHELKEHSVSFAGHDVNRLASLLARVNMEACYGTDKGIRCADSIVEWNDKSFDAVVACPPFNAYLNIPRDASQVQLLARGINTLHNSLEDLLFTRAFEINSAKLVISLEAPSFCYSSKYDAIRRYLVDNNYLDTIILLPEKLLYGTSVPSALIICKSNREVGLPVKYINAELFFTGDDVFERSFSLQSFIKTIEANDETIIGYATREQIVGFDYNLNSSLYNYEMVELEEGQELYSLGDLMLEADYERKTISPLSSFNLYPIGYLKADPIDIWLNQGKPLEHNNDGRAIASRLYHSDGASKYLLYVDGKTAPRLGIYTGSDDFVCHSGIHVAKVNEEIVTPEYLAYLIANHPALKKGNLPLRECKMLSIAVDSLEKQKDIVMSIKQKYAERRKAEQEADAKRLGVKQNISDLEHMLGPTEKRLNNIISRLEKISPDSDNYAEMVKMLRDNYEYMVRIIQYSNADFSRQTFNMKEHLFVDYINKYAAAWRNYGGNYFDLSINNNIEPSRRSVFDSALLTVMFDSILSNAVRHSFHKRKDYTDNNQVVFSLSMVSYQEKPYILISVANNGDTLPSGFTIDDYITKGRYSYNTSRSGLGGYHVYQIVKGHGGFLNLDSNKTWNFIVEVLFPYSYNDINVSNLPEYEQECV